MKKSDFKDLCMLIEDAFGHRMQVLNDGEHGYLICEADINKVGTNLSFRLENNTLVFTKLEVMVQNQGIGSKIIAWLINYAKQKKLDAIEIRNVGKHLVQANHVVIKNGFSFVSQNSVFNNYILELR